MLFAVCGLCWFVRGWLLRVVCCVVLWRLRVDCCLLFGVCRVWFVAFCMVVLVWRLMLVESCLLLVCKFCLLRSDLRCSSHVSAVCCL